MLFNIEPLRMWVHKVLPVVYDDSLSYYEVLSKTVKKLNEVIDLTDEQTKFIQEFSDNLTDAINEWEEGLSTEWTNYKKRIDAEWKNYKSNTNEDIEIWKRLKEVEIERAVAEGIYAFAEYFEEIKNQAVDAADRAGDEADRAEAAAGEAAENAVEAVMPTLQGIFDNRYAFKSAIGSPLVASTAAEMTDTNKIYVYVGDETGYTSGNWYYYDGTAWVSGGVYNSVAVVTDTTLSEAGVPADAKAAGDGINDLKSAFVDLETVDFIIPRCYYWGHMYHTAGDFAAAPQHTSTKFYELRLIENIESPVIVYVDNEEEVGVTSIKIADNTKVGTLTYTTKLYFGTRSKIRFAVMYDDRADNAPVEILNHIHMMLTPSGFLDFLEKFTNTPNVSTNIGYFIDTIKCGTFGFSGNKHAGMLYPAYNSPSASTYVGNASIDRNVFLFYQNEKTFYSETYSNLIPTSGKLKYPSWPTNGFKWGSNGDNGAESLSVSRLEPINNVSSQYANSINSKKQFSRISAACYHNGYYYFASDRDVDLRKIDAETLDIIETYPINSTQLGHANGSVLVGDKWYISDWYDPTTAHIIDLTNDSPTYTEDFVIPVTTYYPNANRGLIYPINDNECYTISWLTYDESESMKEILVKWIYVGTRWRPAQEIIIPVVGITQDIVIDDEKIIIPISKMTSPNRYYLVAFMLINLHTSQIIVINTANREEIEAIIKMDGYYELISATGVFYAIANRQIIWDDFPKIYVQDYTKF